MEEDKKEKKKQADNLVFLNKSYKFIILAIIILIAIGGYYGLIFGQVEKIKEKQLILLKKNSGLDDLNGYLKQFSNLEELATTFQKKNPALTAKLDLALPNSSQIPELLAQMESLVKYSNLNLDGLSFSGGEATPATVKKNAKQAPAETNSEVLADRPGNIKTIKINLGVSKGDYPAFKKFLANIEQHLKILDVTSISFQAMGAAGGAYSVNLQTYYYSPEPVEENSESADVAAPLPTKPEPDNN